MATRRHFTQEYKDQAVSLVLDSGRTIAEVAKSIGVHEMTFGRWVKKATHQTANKPPQPHPTRAAIHCPPINNCVFVNALSSWSLRADDPRPLTESRHAARCGITAQRFTTVLGQPQRWLACPRTAQRTVPAEGSVRRLAHSGFLHKLSQG